MGLEDSINRRQERYETAKEMGMMSPEQIKLDQEISTAIDNFKKHKKLTVAQGRNLIRNHARSWAKRGIDLKDLNEKVNTWNRFEQYGDWLRNQLRPERSTQEIKAERVKKLSGEFGKRQEGYERQWDEYQEYINNLEKNETDEKFPLQDLRDLRIQLRKVMRHATAPNTKDDELNRRAEALHEQVTKRAIEKIEYAIDIISKNFKSGKYDQEKAYDALGTALESITSEDRVRSFDLGMLARRIETEQEKYGKRIGEGPYSTFIATLPLPEGVE